MDRQMDVSKDRQTNKLIDRQTFDFYFMDNYLVTVLKLTFIFWILIPNMDA